MVLRWFYQFSYADAIPIQDAAWRALYDELDQKRIAIYPIDARGLFPDTTVQMVVAQQHLVMSDVGQATGGQAFFNDNALEEITDHLLESDGTFYTLTYSPEDLRVDNKWHKIGVEVDGAPYHLSYRRGYFADGSARQTDQPSGSRTRLLWNGEKLEVSELRDHPIIFQAKVIPTSDAAIANFDQGPGSLPLAQAKKGSVPFLIRYTLPINALTMRDVDGKHKVVLGVAAIGLDRDGTLVEHKAEEITMTLPADILSRSPKLPIVVDQEIDLSKNDQFLHLAVWDTMNGRSGSVDTPLEVPNPAERQEPTSHN